jgi:trigger factor
VQLILAKIAEAEKLEVDETATSTPSSMREAMRTRPEAGQARQGPRQATASSSASVQQSIIFDKAVDFLVSKATVTTVPAKA